MRILYIADGRSATTLSWLKYWVENNHEIHLISTYYCDRPPGLASFETLPVAFAQYARRSSGSKRKPGKRGLVQNFRKLFRSLRYSFGPMSLPGSWIQYNKIVKKIQPDIVHAMRIPYEGMLALKTHRTTPLVVSIWGNDLTLHAKGSFLMRVLTKKVLQRIDGLLADTSRDIRLSREWGYSREKPTLVVPGAGGIRFPVKTTFPSTDELSETLPQVPLIINPRGQREGSLRQDVFFNAIPIVLQRYPDVLFICPSLLGDPEAERLVAELNIGKNTKLWPHLTQIQLWQLFMLSQIYVSPSIHDGTPNSLLEAMAYGCFPVVGDIESMHEWIENGKNGCLVDANSPEAVAEGILFALGSDDLRQTAAIQNARLISEHAELKQCMNKVEAFYRKVLKN